MSEHDPSKCDACQSMPAKLLEDVGLAIKAIEGSQLAVIRVSEPDTYDHLSGWALAHSIAFKVWWGATARNEFVPGMVNILVAPEDGQAGPAPEWFRVRMWSRIEAAQRAGVPPPTGALAVLPTMGGPQ